MIGEPAPDSILHALETLRSTRAAADSAELVLGHARRQFHTACEARAAAQAKFDALVEEITRTGGERRKPRTQGDAPSERRSQESSPP